MEGDVEQEGVVGEEEQVLVPGPLMALTPEARGSLSATVAVIGRKAFQKNMNKCVHFKVAFVGGSEVHWTCFRSVRPEEKRGGNGSRNWGSMRDQLK